jgi:MFS family permease
VSSDVRRARVAVAVVFGLSGLVFGSWASRIPAVRDRLSISDGELGLVLGAMSVGAIAAMPLAGVLSARLGSRTTTRAALALTAVVAAVITAAPSLPALVALGVLMGIAFGSTDVAMNAHGVAVEHRYGRPILSSFHAAFSAGGLAGGALGAACARAGVDVRVQAAAVGVAVGVVGVTWSRRFLPASADRTARTDPVFVRPPRRLWALGLLAFACLLIEGASGDWSAVYLRDDLGASAAAGALAFTAFSVTMTLGRVFGDRIVERFGTLAAVRGGGVVAVAGFALALLAATPVAGVAGFACLGAGMSSIVPIVFRAGANVPGLAAGPGLASVSTVGYAGFLVGPPAIGGLAELTSLPSALWVLVLLGAVIVALAPTTRTAPAPRAAAEPVAA